MQANKEAKAPWLFMVLEVPCPKKLCAGREGPGYDS